ncbi:MAG: fumarylacetoacetate hydrolase family protein [Candidatus Poribacteria bacterium]
MKILQFYIPDKGLRVGIMEGNSDEVFDITSSGIQSTLDLIKRSILLKTPIEAIALSQEKKGIFSYSKLNIHPEKTKPHLLLPVYPPEVWGCGVTYKRSAEMRDEDTTGTKGIYDYVYSAPRPELFFKATSARCVGPNDYIGIRSDSALTAAEPELAYILGDGKEIIGYTVCNDVSAWDIERENPLYLPQSKIFYGCCALGPVISLNSEIKDPYNLNIVCKIIRNGNVIFSGEINSSKIKRTFDELTDFLCRDNPVLPGTTMTTGTGIMIPNDYALAPNDTVEIEIESIGKLSNPVKQL